MSSLPQGQDYYDPWSFLHAWEERYGILTSKQHSRFLSDPRLLEILTSHKYSVEASLDLFKTFDDIIENLYIKSNESREYFEITAEALGMANPQPWEI